ncbi:acyl transferase [Ferruginibacter albus]|nr:acyl transferase [Ferruginibacter albus]
MALEVFQFQYFNNELYQRYCDTFNIEINKITSVEQIPFLPISFFKTHEVTTTAFEPEAIFESSGTTQTINSKHFIKNNNLYKESFSHTFQLFYGKPDDYCILALLPSYLERNNSSLVVMADSLIKASKHPRSGFYLNELNELRTTLLDLERQHQKTILIGVTFALLDFAEKYSMPLSNTVIIETGGMKGRREELTRREVHTILKNSFGVSQIHSEYGMTELLSQAYALNNGIFNCPPWMKVLIRDEDDPLAIHSSTNKPFKGAVNIIDLANIYSCSFIATDDAGQLFPDNSFEILGRLDNSDIRGCSLLSL